MSNFVHLVAKEDQRKQADLMKQLEIEDSLGVWVISRDCPCVVMIENVSMHVFRAASCFIDG